MRVYYAHFMGIYNTHQEQRDVELIKSLGFEPLNPNQPIHQQHCQLRENPMSYFEELVVTCDALAFRALPTGEIPSGVYKEIQVALDNNMPVFELPVNPELRGITVERTRAYLKEIGQR